MSFAPAPWRVTGAPNYRNIKNETSDLLCGPYYVGHGDRHMPNHANVMMQLVEGGFKAQSRPVWTM